MSGSLIDRLWGPGGARLLGGDSVVVGLLAVGVIALAVPTSTGGRATLADVQVAGKPAAVPDLSSDAVAR